MRNQLRQSEKA